MTNNKKQHTAKDKKKLAKETKNTAQAYASEDVTPAPTPWKILSKFPKPIAKKDTSEVKGAAKRVATKKKKLHSKHSKRSTPGQVEEDITPLDHLHRRPETKKTLNNIEKQTLVKSRRISNKVKSTKK